MATEHHERDASVVQRQKKEIPKILRKLDHRSGQGTNLKGMVARV
jgi:hypothetical protein